MRRVLGAVVGASVGLALLFALANLEDWQFFTIRSFVTGRTVMSEIVNHPADLWVMPVLSAIFLIVGAVTGARISKQARH